MFPGYPGSCFPSHPLLASGVKAIAGFPKVFLFASNGTAIEGCQAHRDMSQTARLEKRVGSSGGHGARKKARRNNSRRSAGSDDSPLRTFEWRKRRRARSLLRFAARTRGLRWSPALLELLIQELYVEDEFRALLGAPNRVPRRRYAQAVAVALALRHSWREDDLESITRRLRSRRQVNGGAHKPR
jgi:hypothetical protein